MVPSGEITEDTVQKLLGILEPGDTIVDGGNSNFRDSQRRHKEARKAKISFVDAGVSGGIWGLEVGFCLMVGGDKAPVKRLRPIFESLAPEDGFAHVGPSGAGHFTKMIHNGIEYGLMQAYAEGFEIMRHSEFPLDLRRGGGNLAARLGRSLLAARASLRGLREGGPPPRQNVAPFVEDSGEGRWTIAEAIARGHPGAGDLRGPVRALLVAPVRGRLLRPGAMRRSGTSSAAMRSRLSSRRRPGQIRGELDSAENPLLEGLRLRRTPEPCALVIFGASGDLTQRKLFPALYSLAVPAACCPSSSGSSASLAASRRPRIGSRR